MTELIHDPLFGDIEKTATYWEVDIPAGSERTTHFVLEAKGPRPPIAGLLDYARRLYNEIRDGDLPFRQFAADELLEAVNEDWDPVLDEEEPLDKEALLAGLSQTNVYVQYEPNGSPYARLVYAAEFLSGQWIMIELDSELNKIGAYIE